MQLRDVLKASLQSEQKEVQMMKPVDPGPDTSPSDSLLTFRVCCRSQDSQAKQNSGYSLHQLQGNKAHGTERSGILQKKSEG